MERNRNLRFVVRQALPVGHKPVPGPPVNVPVARDTCYGPGAGQPGPKATRNAPPKVAPPKATFGGGDAGYRPSSRAAWCYNCGCMGHYSKDCKAPRAQVWAAHTAAVGSNADAELEELVEDKAAPQEGRSSLLSIQIDGDEYIAVDIHDNDYYTCDDEEEHMFALTEHQDDRCVRMQHITLQKAADKLQRPQYTPQEKECLVTYVEVNGHPAWMLWDSGSTTMGITPQFAHVNAICVHELTEPLMLQLGTVGSGAVVQFGVEVRVKASGQPTTEYVDIANFDCYDMIIGTPFMHKNKVMLDFVKNQVVVNRTPLRAEKIVLADTDRWLQWY
ncbi:hypothetical protein C0992_004910 [Termitomyces sp. T32_za158]|nr:hypothetical protein C0992_004910 [Termitomyces sp. T32_za158]